MIKFLTLLLAANVIAVSISGGAMAAPKAGGAAPRSVQSRPQQPPTRLSPSISINRQGIISKQTVSGHFNGAAVGRNGPLPKQSFQQSAGTPVPKILVKPDGSKHITPSSGIAIPTRKRQNGKLTTPNGGIAIIHGRNLPNTRIHPPTKARGSAPAYPNGYITQGFKHGTPVHPKTFKPIPKSHPLAHKPLPSRKK